MSKRQLSAILGFWVMIFLFLGFPTKVWDQWIAVVTGLLIILVAYKKTPKAKVSSNPSFVENAVPKSEPVEPKI
jgi:cell division protein FtsW (lipid II flippase)